jgi:hypothetical protein
VVPRVLDPDRMHAMVWLEVLPTIGDEGFVNAFQGWVGALVAPPEQMTMQMDFFQQRLGEEVPKLAHEVTKFSGSARWST